jgi:hypothetical protein
MIPELVNSVMQQILKKGEGQMKKLIKKVENIYAAIAFAEAGEAETAREILRENKEVQKRDRVSERPRKQMRAPGADR